MQISHKDEHIIRDCIEYINFLDNQSPIISTSHLMLNYLYRKYDKARVDAEIDRQFALKKKEKE